MFAQNTINRVERIAVHHTLLSFSAATENVYKKYAQSAISPSYSSWIDKVQTQIPAQATILSWGSIGYLLDYKRNRILTFNQVGLANPLMNLPLNSPPNDYLKYFSKLGVEYVVWEHAGYATKSPQEYQGWTQIGYSHYRKLGYSMLSMYQFMRFLAGYRKPIYADNRVAVFKL